MGCLSVSDLCASTHSSPSPAVVHGHSSGACPPPLRTSKETHVHFLFCLDRNCVWNSCVCCYNVSATGTARTLSCYSRRQYGDCWTTELLLQRAASLPYHVFLFVKGDERLRGRKQLHKAKCCSSTIGATAERR